MQGIQSQKTVPEILRDGEKSLQRGYIGKAKKSVLRATWALVDQGIPPEECQKLLGLTKSILIAEALQKELDKNPVQTKAFIKKCSLALKEKIDTIREKTMENLKNS